MKASKRKIIYCSEKGYQVWQEILRRYAEIDKRARDPFVTICFPKEDEVENAH